MQVRAILEAAISVSKQGIKVFPEIMVPLIGTPQIAEQAEFFSFGTNDLTQMTFGYSRDDVGKFLPIYLSKGILQSDPFEKGVGQLIKVAVERGRRTRPDLKVSVSIKGALHVWALHVVIKIMSVALATRVSALESDDSTLRLTAASPTGSPAPRTKRSADPFSSYNRSSDIPPLLRRSDGFHLNDNATVSNAIKKRNRDVSMVLFLFSRVVDFNVFIGICFFFSS
ncbi:hypothetical protein BHM03_00022588 [Ensete ventricosum]|nr:hypothetical protein BHM03_00022588 [Ensete ventricosum]